LGAGSRKTCSVCSLSQRRRRGRSWRLRRGVIDVSGSRSGAEAVWAGYRLTAGQGSPRGPVQLFWVVVEGQAQVMDKEGGSFKEKGQFILDRTRVQVCIPPPPFSSTTTCSSPRPVLHLQEDWRKVFLSFCSLSVNVYRGA